MKNLFTIFILIIGLSSCTPKLSLVPLSENTAYIDQKAVGIMGSDSLQLEMNFENTFNNYYIFNTTITNYSQRPITVSAANFYYETVLADTTFIAAPLELVSAHIDKNIRRQKKLMKTLTWMEIFEVVSTVAIVAASDGKETSRLQEAWTSQSPARLDIYAETKFMAANEMVNMHDYKDYLQANMLVPTTINPQEAYTGLLLFPKTPKLPGQMINIGFQHENDIYEMIFGSPQPVTKKKTRT